MGFAFGLRLRYRGGVMANVNAGRVGVCIRPASMVRGRVSLSLSDRGIGQCKNDYQYRYRYRYEKGLICGLVLGLSAILNIRY